MIATAGAAPTSTRTPSAGGRLKIAMFAHTYLPHAGGVEVVVWNLARRLAERHDVIVVSSAFAGASGVSREDGMEVHRLPTVHAAERMGVPYPIPTGAGARRALEAVRNADVVHAHGALYAQTLMARHAARVSGAPLILTEHVGFVDYSSPLLNAVQALAWTMIGDGTLKRSDVLVALSSRVHGWLEARTTRPVAFVANGVDCAKFHPRRGAERAVLRRQLGLPEEETLVLFVGRDSTKKNLDVALAMPRDGYTLVTCGAERGITGERLVDLGILPHERMADLFACVDLMAHPATGEGFPLAVQESMASGVPVVLLWDDGYSRLVPAELVVACHSPRDIATGVATLVRDDARRTRLGVAARAWAEREWSWEASVAAYERIYGNAIRARRGAYS